MSPFTTTTSYYFTEVKMVLRKGSSVDELSEMKINVTLPVETAVKFIFIVVEGENPN